MRRHTYINVIDPLHFIDVVPIASWQNLMPPLLAMPNVVITSSDEAFRELLPDTKTPGVESNGMFTTILPSQNGMFRSSRTGFNEMLQKAGIGKVCCLFQVGDVLRVFAPYPIHRIIGCR